MEYAKPHLNYNEQLDLLVSRGLEVDSAPAAIHALKRIGYYRLSAYTYVLRAPAELAEGTGQRRSDRFVAGARFDDALALHDFDTRLRSTLLEGLQQLETGMRVRIGYVLGKRDRFGHLDAAYLDLDRCSKTEPGSVGDVAESPQTAYERWRRRFDDLRHDARNEDYVKHFIVKYDGKLPIWVATEFMTFGCLTALYELLHSKDAAVTARDLQAGNRDVLHAWLKALNVLRNHCAHNARIWNRKTIYPPTKPPVSLVPSRLHHLRRVDNNRVYFLAALCAHLLLELNPTTRWPSQFVTTMRKFKTVNGMTPENTMGFPDGWEHLEIWRHRPATA